MHHADSPEDEEEGSSTMTRDTSLLAYDAAREAIPEKMRLLLNFMEFHCEYGVTCDEYEVHVDGTHQSVSPLFTRLSRMGLIRDSGQRRLTRSNRQAIVWVVGVGDLFIEARPSSRGGLKDAVIEAAILARQTGLWSQFDSALRDLRKS